MGNGLAGRERRIEKMSYVLEPELLHWGALVRLTGAWCGAQTEWLTFIGMAVASALLPLMMSVFLCRLCPPMRSLALTRSLMRLSGLGLDALADAFHRVSRFRPAQSNVKKA